MAANMVFERRVAPEGNEIRRRRWMVCSIDECDVADLSSNHNTPSVDFDYMILGPCSDDTFSFA